MTDHLDIAATAAGFTIDANPSHAPGPFQNRAGSLDDAVMRAAADEAGVRIVTGEEPTALATLNPTPAQRVCQQDHQELLHARWKISSGASGGITIVALAELQEIARGSW